MKHSNITVSSGKLQFAELIKAHFYTPFGVPCEHPLPLPLGEMAERSECPKGRSTREYILPLPLGEVAERSEDGEWYCPAAGGGSGLRKKNHRAAAG